MSFFEFISSKKAAFFAVSFDSIYQQNKVGSA